MRNILTVSVVLFKLDTNRYSFELDSSITPTLTKIYLTLGMYRKKPMLASSKFKICVPEIDVKTATRDNSYQKNKNNNPNRVKKNFGFRIIRNF